MPTLLDLIQCRELLGVQVALEASEIKDNKGFGCNFRARTKRILLLMCEKVTREFY